MMREEVVMRKGPYTSLRPRPTRREDRPERPADSITRLSDTGFVPCYSSAMRRFGSISMLILLGLAGCAGNQVRSIDPADRAKIDQSGMRSAPPPPIAYWKMPRDPGRGEPIHPEPHSSRWGR